mmetsp:Transcript_23362/g.54264  ORF Transcript_23362/g.54264 Transcript_23362/m.54264 type:complete len:204 (+) Transcript_23362:123-734(+)
MGRYSSVQAYADNNANMRSISYEQASGGQQPSGGAVKPEKVQNPYGSTAGAGSGDFHVYRHARAREMGRIKKLEKEHHEDQLQEEYEVTVRENAAREEKKTAKRRRKRKRQKDARERRKHLKQLGIATDNHATITQDNHQDGGDDDDDGDDGEEEFTYIPNKEFEEEGENVVAEGKTTKTEAEEEKKMEPTRSKNTDETKECK